MRDGHFASGRTGRPGHAACASRHQANTQPHLSIPRLALLLTTPGKQVLAQGLFSPAAACSGVHEANMAPARRPSFPLARRHSRVRAQQGPRGGLRESAGHSTGHALQGWDLLQERHQHVPEARTQPLAKSVALCWAVRTLRKGAHGSAPRTRRGLDCPGESRTAAFPAPCDSRRGTHGMRRRRLCDARVLSAISGSPPHTPLLRILALNISPLSPRPAPMSWP